MEQVSGFKWFNVTAVCLVEALVVRAQIARDLHQSEGEELR